MTRTHARRTGYAAAYSLLLAALVVLPGRAAPAPGAVVAAAPVDPSTRLAFTDERDQLYSKALEYDPNFGTTDQLEPAESYLHQENGFVADPAHRGELSASPSGDAQVLVSTTDAPEGEVYTYPTEAGVARVTCDPGVETHPVVSPNGRIAYASNSDGDWDIYVATPVAGGGGVGCDAWGVVNITNDSNGADLWPSWYQLGSTGPPVYGLAFSRAVPGQLPDLYAAQETVPGVWGLGTRLTNTVAIAETQPSVDASSTFVAFTTTEDRPDGSIRLLRLSDPGTSINPWTNPDFDIPNGSEPAWGNHRDQIEPMLAYTTRESDPYGDIASTTFLAQGPGQPGPAFVGSRTLAFERGVAESHPAVVNTFGAGDNTGQLVYTARAVRTISPDTNRILDADITDVRADGAERTVLVDGVSDDARRDDAGPDYSPDGTRIAFSRSEDTLRGREVPGREIWLANADGTGEMSLADATGHQPGDIDLDPVWSPDGDRIAFVRETASANGTAGHPKVWIVDVETGERFQVTPDTDFNDPDNRYDHRHWLDMDPDWSPDGSQLVVKRRTPECCGPTPPPARVAPGWAAPSTPLLPLRAQGGSAAGGALWVIPVQRASVGNPVATNVCPDDACPEEVNGRTPAWSPDGEHIAYSDDGRLRSTLVIGCCASGYFQVGPPPALTGFDDNGEPSLAGATIAWADDPAWAPDGSEIAFAGQPAGQPDQRDIYAIAPDGTGLRVISDGRGPETEPSYSPRVLPADIAVTVAVTGSPAPPNQPITISYTVTNNGPGLAQAVTLATGFTAGGTASAATPSSDCAADGSGCSWPSVPSGTSVAYAVEITYPAPVSGLATGAVSTTSEDSDSANDTAMALYQVVTQVADVAVKVELDEPTGYVGGFRTATVTVSNQGPLTAHGVTLTATWPDKIVDATPSTTWLDLVDPTPDGSSMTPSCLPAGKNCDLGDLVAGAEVSYDVPLEALAEGTDTIEVETSVAASVDPQPGNDTDRTDIEIVQPVIQVLPAVAKPGQVVLVYGEHMPPATSVTMAWDTLQPNESPILVDPGEIEVADDGTMRVSLPVVRRDLLGERLVIATSSTDEFTPVTGDLLVVLRQLQPPDQAGRG